MQGNPLKTLTMQGRIAILQIAIQKHNTRSEHHEIYENAWLRQ